MGVWVNKVADFDKESNLWWMRDGNKGSYPWVHP